MSPKYPMLVVSAIYTAAIIYYSSLPAGASGPGGINPSGGLVHFIVYAVYAAVVLATASKFSLPRPIAVSLFIAAALGAITETIQLFVPGRFCDPIDWLVDVAGAAMGLAVLYLLKRKIKPKRIT
jgi:VanZ family protein